MLWSAGRNAGVEVVASSLDATEHALIEPLIEEFRARARRLRNQSYVFLGSIVLALGFAAWFYYFAPQFAVQEVSAIGENITAKKNELNTLDTERENLNRTFFDTQSEIRQDLYINNISVRRQLPAAEPSFIAVYFLDAQTGWAVGIGGAIRATADH